MTVDKYVLIMLAMNTTGAMLVLSKLESLVAKL